MVYNDPAHRRDGFALPVALLAIIVIGAIVTGGFYAASQEGRIATSTDLANQAFYVAEYGLAEKLGTWKNSFFTEDFTAPDTTLPPESVSLSGSAQGSYTISVRQIGLTMFLVESEGRVTFENRSADAVRKVGTIVRTMTPVMPALTALAIFGGLTVSGNSYITGEDKGGDNCPASTVAGVTAYDSSLVSDTKDHVTGDPPVDEDATLDTAALSDYGALEIADLIAAATKVYEADEDENGMEPVTTTDADGNTVCDTSVRSNWGDTATANPCSDEYPIIHAKGDFHLKTGSGQGILIVEGDLHASGNFTFYGVVIVMGTLQTDGTGNHLEGSVIVQGDGNLDSESTTLGNSLVQYNRCKTERAFNASFRPRPLAARGWMDFTAITRGEALN